MDIYVRLAVRCDGRYFTVPADSFPGESVVAAAALEDYLGLEMADAIELLQKGGVAFNLSGATSVRAVVEGYFAEGLRRRCPSGKFPGSFYFTSSCFNAYVEDDELLLTQVQDALGGDDLRLYLLVTGDAGEPPELRGKIPKTTFSVRSNEGGSHHLPHVHVCYDHRYEWSMDIQTGRVLAGETDYDKVPGRIKRQIINLVQKKQKVLMRIWNSQTNGIKFDVDATLGQVDCRGLV